MSRDRVTQKNSDANEGMDSFLANAERRNYSGNFRIVELVWGEGAGGSRDGGRSMMWITKARADGTRKEVGRKSYFGTAEAVP
jgi:hypothetical protein